MGFLSRLSARTRPNSSGTPFAMPKGMVARAPVPVFREAAPEEAEEVAMTLRRQSAPQVRRQEQKRGDEEKMQRAPADQPDEKKPEDEMKRAIGPAEEPEDDNEPLAPLRRAADEQMDNEEIAPLRRVQRQAEEERMDEDVQASRTIRRAEEVPFEDGEKPLRQPFQSDLEPGAVPPHPDLANEEEPSPLQTLRRDIFAPPKAAPGEQSAAETERVPDTRNIVEDKSADAPWRPVAKADPYGNFRDLPYTGASRAPANERPQVVIDQIDVLIHEPAPAAAAAGRPFDMGRALRARYLRRL